MGVKERIGALFGKIVNLPDERREALLRGERWVGEPPKQGPTPQKKGEGMVSVDDLPKATRVFGDRDWS